MCLFCFFIFFFQAEDGIRDWSVTGVQTCALPISFSFVVERVSKPNGKAHRFVWHDRKAWWQQEQAILCYLIMYGVLRDDAYLKRSEERRVGKSVDLGGRGIIKKNKNSTKNRQTTV